MSDSKTEQNLYTAFVGEAKAALRLKGYAEKADQEGYPQMARLFRAISAAEEVHALKHLRLLKIIQSTEENLKSSFEKESSISENIYPEFIRVALEENNRPAEISFSHARDAEEFHGKLYKDAIDNMIREIDVPYHVCTICGYVVENNAPDKCPICNALTDKFKQID